MAPASQFEAIAELRRRLERMTAHGDPQTAVLPFGIEAVDGHLPGGGLCLGHLHEIIEAGRQRTCRDRHHFRRRNSGAA
jgi:protein ImuA